MELPEIITRLPEADLAFPSSKVRTSVLQSEHGQLLFFQVFEDVEIPAHAHKGQWGTVLEGEIELTVDAKTRLHRPGSSYFVPAGAVHSAKACAGTKLIEFFEEPNRYALRPLAGE
jgi:quercetin dioxygenase-like cupin family protein